MLFIFRFRIFKRDLHNAHIFHNDAEHVVSIRCSGVWAGLSQLSPGVAEGWQHHCAAKAAEEMQEDVETLKANYPTPLCLPPVSLPVLFTP